jgi:transcriptional regulator with PAS, ATPase and Fis domain
MHFPSCRQATQNASVAIQLLQRRLSKNGRCAWPTMRPTPALIPNSPPGYLRQSLCEIIGASERMQRLYKIIERVAESDTTILVRGESGTGKELVARAIAKSGHRRDKPFIRVDCASLPGAMIESELFDEKIGFIGASHPGPIESANGGTLFLDEISSLDLSLQSKLARFLRERGVAYIDGHNIHRSDVRFIAATRHDLGQMMSDGRFREDLYYNINVLPVQVPALRERTGDVALLLNHFLRAYCQAGNIPLKRVANDVMEILENYNWPGNVREIDKVVQHMVLMADGPTVKVRHLPQQLAESRAGGNQALLIPEDGIHFQQEMARIEMAYIQAALRRTNGKKVAAAALLHINRQQLKYLCRKYKIA